METDIAAKDDRQFVTALARGLELLRAFASGEERLSNQELAERCGLPKSTVTRLSYTLTRLGYLVHVPESGRYRLGLQTLALGGTTLSRLDVREASHARLQQLADATQTMVALAIRDDLAMLYIDNCVSEQAILTLRLSLGSRMPLATSAVGRGYLAGATPEVRQMLVARLLALDPPGGDALQAMVAQAVADLAELGCVRSFGAWRREVNAIAVPMRLGASQPLMVVNAAAAASAVPAEVFLREVRPRLVDTVRAIEARYRAA
ncbi:IclR family transcriptional regulator [Pseudorhodoferax sp. Leaf274]|uniref:IclR family transcriptional regulator n=1 Tax=Pseudorhodoferax sp. Leaf274 TaxID=1736318 RepID=UPI0007029039|nr:IclR family transcriptional regulator [Pseudorhodoferax sp. Leaf274]KQP39699.1 hypothetical protein ASF44_08185 [Pseudorhodoferax sp. Leaf274]